MRYKYFFILPFILFIAACSVMDQKPEELQSPMIKLSIFDYPDFTDDIGYRDMIASIKMSFSYLEKIDKNQQFVFGDDNYSATHLIKSLSTFSEFIEKEPTVKELNKFIRINYNVYQAAGLDSKRSVLFTGYFEPILMGSLKGGDDFPYPLYGIPDDFIVVDLENFSNELKGKKIVGRISENSFLPYYNREEIEFENAIVGKAKKIVWLKSRIDRFFLQVQGSGKIILDNNESMNVHYHASNGREYKSIGSLLINEGIIPPEEISMQSIYSYLENNPDEVRRVLSYNPSFVFFKTETEGPLGCINVKLTGERSVATDRSVFPQAALSYIESSKPITDSNNTKIIGWEDMKRFVQNQDTGGAIKGTGRVDFFWGNGDYAKLAAGHMQHMGKLFFLVLKKDQ